MIAPVVIALRYRVVCSPDRDFLRAEPLEAETADFVIRLANGEMVLRPRNKFCAPDEARVAAADFIRAWEINAGLLYGAAAPLRLAYSGAEIEDAGAAPGAHSVMIEETACVCDELSDHLSHARYPPPPLRWHIVPEVEAIWSRLERHLSGREPLLSMAYFCFTVLSQVGGIDAASTKYRIDRNLLSKISRLSSTRGDGRSARKLTQQTIPLAADEGEWPLNAIKRIVAHLMHGGPDDWLR